MPYISKGLRGHWTAEQLKNAIAAVQDGRSVRKAAVEYGIPRRTLRNHVKADSDTKVSGRQPTLSREMEEELVQRIIRFCNIGMPLTRKILQPYVYEFVEKNNLPNMFNKEKKRDGRAWVEGFFKRHPEIAERHAQSMNPAKAQKLNRFIVSDHFKKLKEVMEMLHLFNKPSRIYNLDEKSCRLILHKKKLVLAKKGAKCFHIVSQEHGENVTIVACANAIGQCVPPMVIFKGKRKNPSFGDHLPPGSVFQTADRGSMTTQLFIEWIEQFSRYKCEGNVLPIFDRTSCHLNTGIVDTADSHNITLFCLPSNITHEFQPMDKSVFKPFEAFWDNEVLKFWRLHPDRNITKEKFGELFTPAWSQAMSIPNITSGFRATGIYPFDPQVILEEAFAPSELTHKEPCDLSESESSSSGEEDESSTQDIEQVLETSETTPALATVASAANQTSLSDQVRDTSAVSLQLLQTQPSGSGAAPPFPVPLNTALTTPVPSGQPMSSSSSGGNTSFTELLSTPKLKRKTAASRKKSLNYRAQCVTRNVFGNPQ